MKSEGITCSHLWTWSNSLPSRRRRRRWMTVNSCWLTWGNAAPPSPPWSYDAPPSTSPSQWSRCATGRQTRWSCFALTWKQWQVSNCSSNFVIVNDVSFCRHHHQKSLSRGQKLSLKSNSDPENWDVICPDGSTQSFPGACFQIPPPDPAAIDKVDLYVPQSEVHRCKM